ncbi:NADH dehydrogenase (ubiquinone) 1 alpha subcomplex subunit 6 [Chaetoceros tenuissimus]|uniref:NADH dehydrogenase (Ubiquinone) 1 alpha subcomplex subunit 6 n=1 Tax=Chaetoceros tenuissimus TaxID=426638 RepID=A0AAD3CSI1_9STRA|nr:NADH dehydrogenase (ubiquinone) 1 alpha subcomplex subunit 6 [Chaetoceros tenuissimus]
MPVAVQLALKARATVSPNSVARLYRSVVKELPRALTIYDIDTPLPEARAAIRSKFEYYGQIKDTRVLDMLIEKGYMDLEETLLQHTQRSHLLRSLSLNTEMQGSQRKRLSPESSIDEQFARGY